MNNIKCLSCGLVNFPDASVCKRCGAELAAEAEAPAPDDSPVFEGWGGAKGGGALKACAVCHMPYDESAKRCPHCGRVIEGKALGRARRVAIALIPVFLVLALFAAWRYYSVKAAESALAEQYGIVDTTVREEKQKPWFWSLFRNQPTAEEVLAHNTEVSGGRKALRALKSARMSGEFFIVDRSTQASASNFQASGKIVVQAKAPNLVAAEMEFAGGQSGVRAERGFDGTRGWEMVERNVAGPGSTAPVRRSEVHELAGTELEQLKRQAEVAGLSTLKDKYKSVTFAGREKVGKYVSSGVGAQAREAYKLRGVNAEGKTETLYFDIETGLLTRADFTSDSDGETVTVECYPEDYRKVGDVKVPFTLVYKMKDLIITVRFNDINLNAEIADSTFAMPSY